MNRTPSTDRPAANAARAALLFLAVLGSSCLSAALPAVDSKTSNTVTAVSSRATDAYVRTRQADGTYAPETYAFGEGGYYGGPIHDAAIDSLSFREVARVLSLPLTKQNYVPTRDPKTAKLLIMVYWGMTSGSRDPAAAAFVHGDTQATWGPDALQAEMTDARNASILGYDTDGSWEKGTGPIVHPGDVADVQMNRYFVVLMAYDFQKLWKDRQHRLLWETRFSIREQGNDFGRFFPAMAFYASKYFGQDTRGIVSRQLPQGNVKVGEPESIGIEADPTADAALFGAPKTYPAASADSLPDTKALPPDLAGRIESYRQDRARLQDALVALIKGRKPGNDTREAIDQFNEINSPTISALDRDAESIRNELAKFAAARPAEDRNLSIDTLVQQFNENMRSFELRESLFTHP